MVDEIEPSGVDWAKKGALEEVDNLKSIRATAWTQHGDAFKWLMASLLAINGGACLAIIGGGEIPLDHRLAAGAAFVVGILAALLVAVFGQHSVQRSFAPLPKVVGYWLAVADDGERVETLEGELLEELKQSAKIGIGSRIAGWVSALAFLVGAATAGTGLKQADSDRASMPVERISSVTTSDR